MDHNNLTVLCGRLVVIVAFALIAAIVAASFLQHAWSPELITAQR